ncbi:MAG: hypothetical protein ACE5ID_01880 [Acidobacteriota bacterium]
MAGVAAFVNLDDQVFQIMGVARAAVWNGSEKTILDSLASFGPLSDPAILSVEPMRLKLVRLDRAMSLKEFNRHYPSSVKMEDLAVLNRVGPADRLPRGRLVKQVVGGP